MSADEDTELRDLVAQTLEDNGVLNRIRAELRANVFLALEEQDVLYKKSISNKGLKNFVSTKEGHQAFGLVREFLEFFNLDFTLSVLDPESDIGKKSPRENLINEMNLINADPKVPLLVEALRRKGDSRVSSPTSPKHSKIPQRIHDSKKTENQSKDSTYNNHSVLSPTNDDDDDELLKELGVSPISYTNKTNNNNQSKKKSWLSNDILSKSPEKKISDELPGPGGSLGSLKNAPPLPGVKGKSSLMNDPLADINSPEWDDLLKIDQKIDQLGFSIPKEDIVSSKHSKTTDRSNKQSEYNYEDDFNNSNSQKSDGLSVTEEIEDDLSIGSFAGSKNDDLVTTDQTVSQVSQDGFDYAEDAEF